ncbi:hypothetical protein [Kibdelosporangium phytohabitans]|uniref:hypothetical protein n=1 Tax=Kibdelosporangium phytohabitans TaxID=860235 RepID=UPI0012F7F164|nr:hypothetical protein [Kibdelosporangium phytohabitans]MBE1468419.1 putative spore protein YtfJ [Kibdelosporangium phytohabitans]
MVSLTPVGCQPVLLASGKPHARSDFTQLTFGCAGGGCGGGEVFCFGVPLPLGAVVVDCGTLDGVAVRDDHSTGAGGAAGGAAVVSQATRVVLTAAIEMIVLSLRRRLGNNSAIRPPSRQKG